MRKDLIDFAKTRVTVRVRFSSLLSILATIASTVSVVGVAYGWGFVGHRFINRNAVIHLPSTMPQFVAQQSFFENHAMDADNRKSLDPEEAPKHWLNIDFYPNFRTMPRNLDSLIAQYGWSTVRQNGLNPWATMWALDSLTARLARGEWDSAYFSASDLGHYVADAHQPLHCTVNYNGQYTGNTGIHSRYESTMITNYQSSLTVRQDTVRYIDDPLEYAFDYIIHSNSLVDSVLSADNYAKAQSGWSGQGTPPSLYYVYLWERTRGFTLDQIQRATVALANLWYVAWVNAGFIQPPTFVTADHGKFDRLPHLFQNYPNPFNPSTTISYYLPAEGLVSLQIFDVSGKLVASVAEVLRRAGSHEFVFDGAGLASGIYLYQLQFGGYAERRKMVILR